MPGQKLKNNEEQSLEFLSGNMEPKNTSISTQEIYSKKSRDTSSENSDSAMPEVMNSHSNLDDCEDDTVSNITTIQWLTVVILCFVNLINYMDRYTIAGILDKVQKHFDITDDKGGLLQTAFVISYMVFAPLFGYLGDRYNRKLLMAFGVFLWSLTTFAGSFMDSYGYFLFFRMLVGIGEASYSTIAPTIISDLFVKNIRSVMLAAFYFAIPVGSGLGYIVGSETTKLLGSWRWGLRVTPIFGLVAVLLILFVMQEPPRGLSEGQSHVEATTWKNDIKILLKNRTFMLSTGGFTCVAFVTGALAWWGPQFVHSGLVLQPGQSQTDLSSVTYVFGILTMIAGLIGVPLGMSLSKRLRKDYEQADPMICAVGLLVSAPVLFSAACTAKYNITICYVLIFVGQVFTNLNWSIVADILLYVVAPQRRSTAEAFQILVSHALGDAGSPYLIGVLSEFFKKTLNGGTAIALSSAVASVAVSASIDATMATDANEIRFRSLQYALFTTCFVEVIGGFFFLFAALYVVEDKAAAKRQLQGEDNPVAQSDIYSDVLDVETGKHS